MRIHNLLFAGIAAACLTCNSEQKKITNEKMIMVTDPHSYAQPNDARVTHLRWKATVDFDRKIIDAVASWTIEKSADADIIILDTKGLNIKKITLDDGTNTEYRLAEPDSILGQALAVLIRPATKTS